MRNFLLLFTLFLFSFCRAQNAKEPLITESLVPTVITPSDSCYAIKRTYIYANEKNEYTSKSRKEIYYLLIDKDGILIKEPKEFKVIGASFTIPPDKKEQLKRKLREQGINTEEL